MVCVTIHKERGGGDDILETLLDKGYLKHRRSRIAAYAGNSPLAAAYTDRRITVGLTAVDWHH